MTAEIKTPTPQLQKPEAIVPTDDRDRRVERKGANIL